MNEDERTNVFKQKLNFQERLKQEKIMEKNKINQDWTKLQDDSYTQEVSFIVKFLRKKAIAY